MLTLHLERALHAPRSRLFDVLVQPAQLARWWGPKGFSAPSIELDLRVGGEYRIEMQPPDGDRFFLRGEFRRVEPPAQLAYTFAWEDPDPDDRETLVELLLHDLGDATELILDQGPFATEARRSLHEQGWTEALDRLHELITTQER